MQFINVPVPYDAPVPHLPPPQADDPFAQPAINAHQYHHLPADLAQRLAALPPLQPVHGRGRGRGIPPLPPVPPVCNFFFIAKI